MHAGTYMITYNDGLKTDKWSSLTLLGGSVKSDRLLRRFESTGNKRIDTGISFIADFNVDESVRIRMSPSVNTILLHDLDYSTITILKIWLM